MRFLNHFAERQGLVDLRYPFRLMEKELDAYRRLFKPKSVVYGKILSQWPHLFPPLVLRYIIYRRVNGSEDLTRAAQQTSSGSYTNSKALGMIK